jgi:hypothetical protein
MKKILKILLVLSLLVIYSCKEPANIFVGNVSIDKGKLIVDTKTYLGDDNLRILVNEIRSPDFKSKLSVKDIPVFIQSFLDSLADTFSIANPGEEWKCCCTQPMEIDYSTQREIIDTKTGDTLLQVSMKCKDVPERELTYFGLGKNTAVLTYHTGGWGVMEHLLVIRFENEKVQDFRHTDVNKDLKSTAEIIQYLAESGWGIVGSTSL